MTLDAAGQETNAAREPIPATSRREAFAHAVTEHHTRLIRLAFLLCRNHEHAEDAVAEAYAKSWPKYRNGSVRDLPSYLRRATVNQVNAGFRKLRLERRDLERHRVDELEIPASNDRTDIAELLTTALAQLPFDQRAVIVLRYYEDLTEQQIAATLAIRRGTVKSRCARGLEQLSRLLGPEAGPTPVAATREPEVTLDERATTGWAARWTAEPLAAEAGA